MTTCVIQVVQHLRPGGLENLALNLARHSRYAHQIISLEGQAEAAMQQWQALKCLQPAPIFLNKPAGLSLSTLRALRRQIQRLQPLAVHSHHIGPLFYTALSHLPRRLRLIHTEHDAWHLQQRRARQLQSLLLTWARPVHVSVGQHVADSVNTIWPALNSRIIVNSVDMQRFAPADKNASRAALGLPEKAWVIACAARLESVKGVDVLIRAHAALADDSVLAIAGQGSQGEDLRALCEQLGSHQRVHFLGQLEQPEQLYQAADLYCQPSRNEGLPLAPIEAQACGTPVVLSAVGASAQISGWPGSYCVPPADHVALAHQLGQLYRQALPSPRNAVLQAFDLAQMCQRYDALYAGEPAA